MAFTDVELAILSQCAYKDYPKDNESKNLYDFVNSEKMHKYLKGELGDAYAGAVKEFTEKIKDQPYEIVRSVDNDQTGFAAIAIKDPNNEITVVCRGTEFEFSKDVIKDLFADALLINTLESNQQASMRKFVADLENDGHQTFNFSGHSLGGNLAMYGALCLNDKSKLEQVVTFNAPGFNTAFLTVNKQNFENVSSKFTNYQNERDFVSESFDVPGNVVVLEGKETSESDPTGWYSHSLNKLRVGAEGNTYNFVQNKTSKKNRTFLGDIFKGGTIITNGATTTGLVGAYYASQVGVAVSSRISITSASIKVPVDTLRDCARKMQELADENVAIFDRLYNTLQCLEGSGEWTGASARAAISATENNKKKYSEAINELNELADFVQKYACEISAKDEEIMRKIASA